MNNEEVALALTRMRELSKERKFVQSVDFSLNFTGIDFKKPENRIDVDVSFPNPTGKQAEAKVLVFVKDKNFAEQIKSSAKIILESQIQNIKTKEIEQLLTEYTLFLAEGSSILTVGKYLGQQLAPKGKMPKPISADLKSFQAAVSKASTSIKVSNSKGKFMPLVHVLVGKEKDDDAKIIENVLVVYNSVLSSIGGKKQFVKSGFVKLTMGPAIKIGLTKNELEQLKKKIEKKMAKKKVEKK